MEHFSHDKIGSAASIQVSKSNASSSRSQSHQHSMLRIDNLPTETPNVASGSIMTLQDVNTTPIKSIINQENPDMSNPNRKS